MKTSHSLKSETSRKRCILAMISLTTIAVTFCTSMGIWNHFYELTSYSTNEVVSLLLSGVVLGVIATSFYRMVCSNEIERTGNIA